MAVSGAAFKCDLLSSCAAPGDARVLAYADSACLFYSREVVVFKLPATCQVPYQAREEVTTQTFTAETKKPVP